MTEMICEQDNLIENTHSTSSLTKNQGQETQLSHQLLEDNSKFWYHSEVVAARWRVNYKFKKTLHLNAKELKKFAKKSRINQKSSMLLGPQPRFSLQKLSKTRL